MDLIDALRTTGAVREFRDDAVPDEVLARILETARFAPNGGNRQAWRVVVVKDRAVRRAIRDAYLEEWPQYLALSAAGLVPWSSVADRAAEAAALARTPGPSATPGGPAAGDFAGRLDEHPVMLVLLADLRALATVDRDLGRYPLSGGASIYPFAWSLLLAARAEGLGGVLTTVAIRQEERLRPVLHLEATTVLAGVMVLGVPVHQVSRLRRAEVDTFTTLDTADGAPFGAAPGGA